MPSDASTDSQNPTDDSSRTPLTVAEPDLPSLYDGPDAQSDKAQQGVFRAVEASLSASVLAAVLGTFSVKSGGVDLAAVIASAAFLVAIACSAWLLWGKPDRRWYNARAAAESVKTLAWQYAVAGGEFPRPDGDVAESQFTARLTDVLADLKGLTLPSKSPDRQITDWMAQTRGSSLQTRKAVYAEKRVADQRSWYSTNAAANEKRRLAWSLATISFQALGLAGGVARAFLGIAAAATGAATAWSRTKDYAELAQAYAVTAQEVALIADRVQAPQVEQAWAEFVEEAERAFSREHTLWKARRGHSSVVA